MSNASYNRYKRLMSLFPGSVTDVGTITAVGTGEVTITLLDGSTTTAKGTGTVDTMVTIKDGVVVGDAPELTTNVIEV